MSWWSEIMVVGDLDVRMGMDGDELETQEVWVQGHTQVDGGSGDDVANLNGDYDESNEPQGPTRVQGGFWFPSPWPVIEEIPLNTTIDIFNFETLLNFDNPN